MKLAENAETHAQRKCSNLDYNNLHQQNHFQYNIFHMNSADSMQLNATQLLSIKKMHRLQNNLYFYCEKTEYFKYKCTKAAKITVSKRHDCESSVYQETSNYRKAYQKTFHEEIQYNHTVH